MAETKATHEITHPSLYLMVKGKLQEMEVGAKITLTKAQGEALVKNGKVAVIGKSDPVNTTK